MSESTMRDEISAAFDAAEKEESPAEPAAPPASDAPASPEAAAPATPIGGERERDPATGRFVKAEGAAEKAPGAPEEPPKAPPPPVEATPAPAKPVEPPTFAMEGARAPQSWRPAVREKFATLPPEVQEEAIRVDREVRRTMQESAEARQMTQRVQEILRPAEPFFRAQGVDSLGFVNNAVQTVLALSAGPQETKAQAIAQLIKLYGVDIQTLDTVLAGTMQPGAQQPQVYRDPRVDELYQAINAAKQQRDSQLEVQAREGIAKVESLEFFEDLRMDMADILDLAANRGVAMTPEEAYNRAAALHPEISKVLEQRKAAERLTANPSGSTQRAKAAASSIKGTPEAPVPNAQPENLRDQLRAAWDAAEKSR